MKSIQISKKEYIKPEIKVEELTLKTLLGENGWMSSASDRSKIIAAQQS